jgi:uncharacterized membrane protein YadS
LDAWRALDGAASLAANACLAVAMAAVGLGTSVSRLRVLGLRPAAVGLATALAVGAVSYGVLRLLG